MIGTLKSEFRKLLTVRSTYVIFLIGLLLIALFAGYGDGFKGSASTLQQPGLLMSESANAVQFAGLVFAFVGLLLIGHEYRYNTIMHTLTNTNRRLKVLLAKFIAITVLAVIACLLFAAFSPLCDLIGVHLRNHHLATQHFYFWQVIWRCVFVGWGYSMYAFVLTVIMRNQIGSIVTFLLIPLLGENLLGHIFKNAMKYFPFTDLQSVLSPLLSASAQGGVTPHAPLWALVYIVGGLAVGGVLFVVRDAN